MRSPRQDGLRVREFPEAPFAVVGSHARVARAVERHAPDHHMDADLVDASAAELLRRHHALRPFPVFREDVHRQRVFPLRDDAEELFGLVVPERDDRKQRAEQFVPDDLLVDLHRIEDRRRKAVRLPVSRPAENDAVPVLLRQPFAFFIDGGRDQFRIVGVGLRLLADLPHEFSLQFFEESLRRLFRDGDLVDVDADLPRVAELEKGDLPRRVPKIGVLPDDAPVAGLSAELQRDRDEIVRRFFEHMLRHGRRSGIEDLVEALFQAQVRGVVSAVYHGDELLGKNVGDQFFEGLRARGGFRARFQHRGVAPGNGGSQHAQRQQDREIERADDQGHSVRHLVNGRRRARKAKHAAEPAFRPCPLPEPAKDLVHLDDDRPDVAEISLDRTFAEILEQRRFERAALIGHRLPELFELLDPPLHVERDAGAEKLLLLPDDPVYLFSRIRHFTDSFRSGGPSISFPRSVRDRERCTAGLPFFP